MNSRGKYASGFSIHFIRFTHKTLEDPLHSLAHDFPIGTTMWQSWENVLIPMTEVMG